MADRLKVYLSKSKSGEVDPLMYMRSQLSELDCEVVEFMGESYDPKIVDDVDILLCLPPVCEYNGKYIAVGKGQFEEARRFTRKRHYTNNIEPAYAIINVFGKSFVAYAMTDLETNITNNWTVNYGRIYYDKSRKMSLDLLTTNFGIKRIGSSDLILKRLLIVSSKSK